MRQLNNRERTRERGLGHDDAAPLHPAWREFMRFCQELKYGEIERAENPGWVAHSGGGGGEENKIRRIAPAFRRAMPAEESV